MGECDAQNHETYKREEDDTISVKRNLFIFSSLTALIFLFVLEQHDGMGRTTTHLGQLDGREFDTTYTAWILMIFFVFLLSSSIDERARISQSWEAAREGLGFLFGGHILCASSVIYMPDLFFFFYLFIFSIAMTK